jgi:hypothetical protein
MTPAGPPAGLIWGNLNNLIGSCHIGWRTQAFIDVSDFSRMPSLAILMPREIGIRRSACPGRRASRSREGWCV